jgi:hypothetical protein
MELPNIAIVSQPKQVQTPQQQVTMAKRDMSAVAQAGAGLTVSVTGETRQKQLQQR